MWRILRLMKLNIQLIFIFDGPGQPWKRGGTAGRVDYDKTRLLIQLLDRLKIPHHRAPAEAEAECARLQQLGVVDAVWSDDADSLMFGCTMLIRDHRPKDPKKTEAKEDIRLVDVFDTTTIEQQFGLTQSGILLFVILAGGDYNTKGLENCGPVAALEAIGYDLDPWLRLFGIAQCLSSREIWTGGQSNCLNTSTHRGELYMFRRDFRETYTSRTTGTRKSHQMSSCTT
jgi:Holliday junction resolvase YEN1